MKRNVVAMPGDGIGKVVLPEAIRVLDAVGFDAELRPRRHRLGLLVQGRQCPSGPDDRPLDAAQARPLRGDHLQTEGQGRRGTRSGASGQGPHLLQPDRHHAAEVRSRHLHPPLHRLRGQPAQLHPPGRQGRLRGAEGQRRDLPPEHRGPLRRRGVDEPSRQRPPGARDPREDETLQECAEPGPGHLHPDHHPRRLAADHPRRLRVSPRSSATSPSPSARSRTCCARLPACSRRRPRRSRRTTRT